MSLVECDEYTSRVAPRFLELPLSPQPGTPRLKTPVLPGPSRFSQAGEVNSETPVVAQDSCDTGSSVVIRSSSIDGTGGFAARDIEAGSHIIEYVGEKINKAESLRRCELDNPYIFALDEEWDLDGDVAWNPARFLNHSCAPNCEVQNIENHLWVIACRDIQAGEELTFNYGYDLVDYGEHPCRCGTSECVGYIVAEEFFPTIRERKGSGATRES